MTLMSPALYFFCLLENRQADHIPQLEGYFTGRFQYSSDSIILLSDNKYLKILDFPRLLKLNVHAFA